VKLSERLKDFQSSDLTLKDLLECVSIAEELEGDLNNLAVKNFNLHNRTEKESPTLSRRDQMAMAAMQGMRANPNLSGPLHELAEFSVKSADALIEELDK